MKKIMYILFSLIFTINTAYADDIKVINPYSIGGMAHKTASYLNTQFPEVFTEVLKVNNCAQAVKILESTDEPTIFMWDILGSAVTSDKTCHVINEENFVSIYSSAYYSVFALESNPENNLDKFMNGKAKIGASSASGLLQKIQMRKMLEGLESNSKYVPYASSGDAIAALEIGEVDFVLTGRARPHFKQIISGDPNSKDVPSISDYFDNSFSRPGNYLSILGVNVDKEEVNLYLKETYQEKDWKDIFPGYNYELSKLSPEDQFKFLMKDVEVFLAEMQSE